MNHYAFLREVEFLSQFSDQERERLQALIREESFSKGDFIFQKNSAGGKIYIVKEGSVEIRKGVGRDRKLTRLARLYHGEVFGELSFFDEKPHSADAISAGPGETELLSICKPDFDQLMDESQALANKVMRGILQNVSRRLRHADEALQSLLPSDNPYRMEV